MTDDQDVWIDGGSCIANLLNFDGCIGERHGCVYADAAADRASHMGHQNIGSCLGHLHRFVHVENVGASQKIQLVRNPDHFHFKVIAHSRLFKMNAECAVDEPDGWEVLHACKAKIANLRQKSVHAPEGVGSTNAGEDGRVLDHGQNFFSHFNHNLICIAVGEQSGTGPAARHAIAAGIINNYQICATGFSKLG